MEIRNLKDVDADEIFDCFVLAFTNYVIPIEFNREAMKKRWIDAGVDFELSYGAFDGSKLVGFILQVPVGKNLYNFMIGVIPSHRGRKIIQKMYEEMKIKIKGFETFSLEVIRENTPALKLYQKLGFTIERELVSLKGNLSIDKEPDHNFTYEILPLQRLPQMTELRLARPAMEFSWPVIAQNPLLHELHCLKENDRPVAYAIYSPQTLALKEIGSQSQREDYLDQLFLQMKLNHESLRIMNLDSGARELICYFEKRNLESFVTQFEMKRDFNL